MQDFLEVDRIGIMKCKKNVLRQLVFRHFKFKFGRNYLFKR